MAFNKLTNAEVERLACLLEMFDFELHEALYAGASKDFNASNCDADDAERIATALNAAAGASLPMILESSVHAVVSGDADLSDVAAIDVRDLVDR